MRTLSILVLLFTSGLANADYIALPRAFAQQYTDAQAEGIYTLTLASAEGNRQLKQAELIRSYAEVVNSGRYNVHEVTTYYRDGYLDLVRIVVLPFEGEGNRLRLYIHVATEGATPSEEEFEHHSAMAGYMLRHHPDMVPMVAVRDGIQEILYLEPSGFDAHATLGSLAKDPTLDAAFAGLRK